MFGFDRLTTGGFDRLTTGGFDRLTTGGCCVYSDTVDAYVPCTSPSISNEMEAIVEDWQPSPSDY